jgi:predicted HicB family RNase H-like nuclease
MNRAFSPDPGDTRPSQAGEVYMSDTMEYKGYVGSVQYSSEDDVFHGKLENIRDLVTYEGTDITSVKSAFFEAVDDYLSECKKRKKEPDVPFKGTFKSG